MFGMLVTTLLLTAPGCTWITDWFGGFMGKYSSVKTITLKDLKKRIKTSYKLQVINVLSKDSYDDCHIKGSLNVPLKGLKSAAKKWSKDQEIVVYCASYQCPASKEAFLILENLGFTNILAYEGGMKEWKQKGNQVVGPCEAAYLK